MNKDIFSSSFMLSCKAPTYRTQRFNVNSQIIRFLPRFRQLKCQNSPQKPNNGLRNLIGLPSHVFASLAPSVHAAEAVTPASPPEATQGKTPALADMPPGHGAGGAASPQGSSFQQSSIIVFDEEIAAELAKETGMDRLREIWNFA